MNTTKFSPSRRRLALALGATGLGMGLNMPARAQAYPSKPIQLIVGYAPGGAVDMVGRIVADMLSQYMNANVVVNNQSGAAGVIAAQKVANSAPDGYTLLLGSCNEMSATKFVNPAQKYDPETDFSLLGLVATSPIVWAAGEHANIKTIEECLTKVRAAPGKYSYGSSGVGSVLHFAGEMLKQKAGVDILHIPYRSTGALTTDLIGGAIEFAMLSTTAAQPFIDSGRINPLGISSAARLPMLPDIPALGENSALQGYDFTTWFSLVAPKGLPVDIAGMLTEALRKGLQDPKYRKRLEASGNLPADRLEDLLPVMQADSRKYAELVKVMDMTL